MHPRVRSWAFAPYVLVSLWHLPTPLGPWSDLAVMAAYTVGQLLIAVGTILAPARAATRLGGPGAT